MSLRAASRKERETTVTLTFTRKVRQVEQICPVCQNTFWGSPLRTYCSQACKSRANYRRNADSLKEARMKKYRQAKQQTTGKSAR